MYNPAHFRIEDPAEAFLLIRDYPLATLIAHAPGAALDDTRIAHLPLIAVPEQSVLLGHLSRANHLRMGPVTCVFNGPQGYISPSWYTNPSEDVPTWNYAVVHVYGIVRRVEDPASLESILQAQVRAAEARFDPSWNYAIPDELRTDLLRGISGIEITIERVEAKFKLSQNRDRADRLGAIAGLRNSGSRELAGWMERLGLTS